MLNKNLKCSSSIVLETMLNSYVWLVGSKLDNTDTEYPLSLLKVLLDNTDLYMHIPNSSKMLFKAIHALYFEHYDWKTIFKNKNNLAIAMEKAYLKHQKNLFSMFS